MKESEFPDDAVKESEFPDDVRPLTSPGGEDADLPETYSDDGDAEGLPPTQCSLILMSGFVDALLRCLLMKCEKCEAKCS